MWSWRNQGIWIRSTERPPDQLKFSHAEQRRHPSDMNCIVPKYNKVQEGYLSLQLVSVQCHESSIIDIACLNCVSLSIVDSVSSNDTVWTVREIPGD